jgi:hypothetical protein
MKKLLFTLVSGLFLTACNIIPGERVQVESGSDKTEVEKLFTVDGVSVYRFHDGGDVIYFTNSTGTVKCYSASDDEIKARQIICNGKIETENSEN